MRKLMLAVAATTVMLIPVFEPWTVEAAILGGATKIPPAAANVSRPVEGAACRGWGRWCGPGYTRACGPYRCWCRPCW